MTHIFEVPGIFAILLVFTIFYVRRTNVLKGAYE
jgi:hypothetical protein